MAYSKQSNRVLAGGLNLLPPADKVQEADSSILQNWRVDQAGQLKSRRGMQREVAGLSGGPIHSLFRIGTDRYAGVGGDLRRGTQLQTVVGSGFDGQPLGIAAYQDAVWVMNQRKRAVFGAQGFQNWGIEAPTTAPAAAAGATQTTPFLEFDEAEGWYVTYITSDGAVENEEIEVVTTAEGVVSATQGSNVVNGEGTQFTSLMVGQTITITGLNFDTITTIATVASAEQITIVGNYTDESSSGMTFKVTRLAKTLNWDSSNKQSGTHSLHISAYAAGKYQIRRPDFAPVDLSLGASKAEDTFRCWFYANRPELVQSINIELYSGSGGDRKGAVVYIDPSVLQQTAYSWTLLEIRRQFDTSAIVSSNTEFNDLMAQVREAEEAGDTAKAAVLRAAAQTLYDQLLKNVPYFRVAAGFDWSQVTSMVVEVNVTDAIDFHLDACSMAGGIQGSLEGDLSYYVTYVNDQDVESNPSPVSNTITVKQQPVNLTLPVSPDAQVTRRYVYRIGGGISSPALRVFVVWDNTATSAVDFITVAEAQKNNDVLLLDNDTPPAAAGVVGPYLGRLLAWNSVAHPNRLWWTPVGEPHKWPSANDEEEGNWIDVGEAYEPIYAVVNHKRMARIYKARTIHRLLGDADENDPELANSDIGLIGRQAIASRGGTDYFASSEGIYSFNGDSEQKISLAIDPIFKGEYADLGNEFVAPMSQDYASTAVMAIVNGRLHFSYPEEGKTSPSNTLICDLDTGRWYTHRLADSFGATGFTALAYEGTGNQWLGAVSSGSTAALYTLDDGETDDTTAIPVKWQSRYLDQGIPDTEKTYADFVIDFRTAVGQQTPSTLSVDLVFDNGTVVNLGTISSASRAKKTFSLNSALGIKATNCAIRVTGNVTSTCWIYAAYIHFYVENRKGLSFDTGVFELAGGGAGECDVFEMEVTGSAAITWALFTDLPDAGLAQRLTGTIPARAGRRPSLASFPKQEGYHGRLVFGSTEPFQMHNLRMRSRAYGQYIDGTQGQTWKLLPFRLGDGRVVQLKDLVMEYEGAAGGNITIASDLPGSSLATRKTLVLPPSARQRTEPFPFEPLIEGSLFEFGGNSTGALKPLSGVLRWRPIGVYFDGTKAETWEIEVDLGQPQQLAEIELDLDTDGPMSLTVGLNLPGQDIATRTTHTVNTETTTAGRRPWNIRVPNYLKGQILRLRLSGPTVVRMWGGKIYVRGTGTIAGNWQWIPLPIPPTPVDWQSYRLPIQPTDLGFRWITFPMDEAG